MTHQEKLAFIRAKCIASNPSIIEFPRFPEDSETAEAIKVLAKIANTHLVTKEIEYLGAIDLEKYEEEKRTAYVRELEQRYPSRRPIRLSDVLNAIMHTEHVVCIASNERFELFDKAKNEWVQQFKTWYLANDDLNAQDPETISFLYDVLK